MEDSKRPDFQIATKVWRSGIPRLTFATTDHDVSTLGNATHSDLRAIPRVADNAREHGVMLFGLATGARHSLTEALRQMRAYTALISKGENAIDLPVVQFDQIRFCDHSEDAKSFGIEVPPTHQPAPTR